MLLARASAQVLAIGVTRTSVSTAASPLANVRPNRAPSSSASASSNRSRGTKLNEPLVISSAHAEDFTCGQTVDGDAT